MKRLYPDVTCYQNGFIEVGCGHSLYYEQSGNPEGIPVIFIHGGPGAGLPPNYKCFFDSNRYRIIGFEQRGCGRSTPSACIKNNDTWLNVEDIETLRRYLNVPDWLVFGGSWGSTLALLYTFKYAAHVNGLILRGVFLARQQDRDWFLSPNSAAAQLFPEYYRQFIKGIAAPLTSASICEYYYNTLKADNEVQRHAALKRWYQWEERLSRVSLPPGTGDSTSQYPLSLVTTLATLECHFLINKCFLEEGYILDNIDKISDIPGTIIHGRYDMICKTEAAETLHKSWPGSQLQIIPEAGHSTSEPGIAYALCRATRDMARFLKEQK
ncbi:prolyl aminopeptidase [Alteromonas sp. 1_MG-2023]|uniref:prolyl aminopeptidase n=1 Tax=Alteromonas sp. 1_MG-2023 TaxID=3062669 RepID=UPI0026E160E2|nr:prolyl aminopeptidase [Alteromonas sp. 1_MG-2023]MDO6567989.1 prolyl aminopeptidase [Alteromonas sp. 1_MG-2023]